MGINLEVGIALEKIVSIAANQKRRNVRVKESCLIGQNGPIAQERVTLDLSQEIEYVQVNFAANSYQRRNHVTLIFATLPTITMEPVLMVLVMVKTNLITVQTVVKTVTKAMAQMNLDRMLTRWDLVRTLLVQLEWKNQTVYPFVQ